MSKVEETRLNDDDNVLEFDTDEEAHDIDHKFTNNNDKINDH